MSNVVSAVELSERQMRVAMKSKDHMIRWLEASGRPWLIFNAKHLIEALPWPSGDEALIQIIACYRDHRAMIPTGEMKSVENPATGEMVNAVQYHPELLTLVEMDRAVRSLISQITSVDPSWSLNNPPL